MPVIPDPSPANDVDREAVVLSTCLCVPEAYETAKGLLETRHFYSTAHRWIWEAMGAVGCDVDRIAQWLKDNDRLEQIGSTPYLLQLLNEVPTRLPIEDEASVLVLLTAQRNLVGSLQQATALAQSGRVQEAVELARGVEEGDQAPAGRVHVLDTAAIFAPLPPIDWLVEGLSLAKGAPILVAGKGYAGKTLSVQSMAVSLALGAPVWGRFSCKQSSVLHLDYEQGEHMSRERYQRLARGLGVCEEELGGRLALATYPDVRLDDDDAFETMCRLCDGYDAVVIDSFRAACPGLEENSSTARVPLDMLGRLSDKLCCVVIVLHHARKDQVGAANSGAETMRGSGAIFDAAGGMFVMRGKKGEDTHVEHHKERFRGKPTPDFLLRRTDVYDDTGEVSVGVVVQAHDPEEPPDNSAAGRLEADIERVLAHIQRHPGCSVRELRAGCGIRATRFRDVWALCLERNYARYEQDDAGRKKYRCYIVDGKEVDGDPWRGWADD